VGGLNPAYVGKSVRELCQKTHPLRRDLLARLSRNQGPSSITPTDTDAQLETPTAFAPLTFDPPTRENPVSMDRPRFLSTQLANA
jgi:hypothetical protein